MTNTTDVTLLDLKKSGEQAISINGPAGNIEALLNVPTNADQSRAVAIICHPHPLHGGSMNNKVVYTIGKAFSNLGVPSIRFNFRGVGKSEGVFADSIGETDDTLAVIAFAKQCYPEHQIWLSGFSFGAYVSLRATQACEVNQLITVAPAVNLYNLDDYRPVNCPWLLIQGTDDEIVPVEAVENWISTLKPRPELQLLENTGHFFHGKLIELRERIEEHLQKHEDY